MLHKRFPVFSNPHIERILTANIVVINESPKNSECPDSAAFFMVNGVVRVIFSAADKFKITKILTGENFAGGSSKVSVDITRQMNKVFFKNVLC